MMKYFLITIAFVFLLAGCSGQPTFSADNNQFAPFHISSISSPVEGKVFAPGTIVPLRFGWDVLPGYTDPVPGIFPIATVAVSGGKVVNTRGSTLPGVIDTLLADAGNVVEGWVPISEQTAEYYWQAPMEGGPVTICVSTAGNELDKKSAYRKTVQVEVLWIH